MDGKAEKRGGEWLEKVIRKNRSQKILFLLDYLTYNRHTGQSYRQTDRSIRYLKLRQTRNWGCKEVRKRGREKRSVKGTFKLNFREKNYVGNLFLACF